MDTGEGLATLFVGELSRYRDVLVFADDPREAIAGADFLRPHTLDEMMQRFRPQFAGEDPRGLASIWSKTYFVRLIPPVMAAALLLDRRLPLRIDELAVVVNSDGMPQAFKLPNQGEPFMDRHPGPFERFAHLVEDNLQPFIGALCAHTGLSPKVLWSNAGMYFEWFLRELCKLAEPPGTLADAETLINSLRTPDGLRNPLYAPVRYVEVEDAAGQPQLWRQRRLCCIRDLLPGVGLCPNCPRLERPPQPGH